jgi:opacity protein-like surface antigen
MYQYLGKKTALLLAVLSSAQFANAESNRKFYIGLEYGGLIPLSKKFKIDDVNVKASTDRVDGLRLGYQFYPDMFIDFSFSRRHGVQMSATMNEDLPVGVKSAWGTGKFRYDSYILSIKYAMPRDSKITPYVGAGLGVAKVGIKNENKFSVDVPAIGFKGESGIVAKSSKITPAVRIYAGADAKVSDFLSLYLDTRIEVTKKVPVDFKMYFPGTTNVVREKRVKTRMGVAEAVLGVKLSL